MITVGLIVGGLVVFFAVWLWQRQPKSEIETIGTAKEELKVDQKEEFQITPTEGSVLGSKKASFEGKTKPQSRVLIFSNDFQTVVASDDAGSFKQDVSLVSDLNQVDIVVLAPDLSQVLKKSLNLYVTSEKILGNQVLANTVRAILDNVITIAYQGAEKSILISKSTTVDLPEDVSDEDSGATTSATASIRVGDFIIALGDPKDKESLSAKKVQIIREGKPQNNIQFVVAKILTVPKQNSFSVKSNSDSKIIELTLSKTSQVSQDDKVGSVADIAKEKTAIVFYHADTGKKVVDSIYLLPQR